MLIGLNSPYPQAGKDTIADYLVEVFGFKRLAFADRLREVCLALDPYVGTEGSPFQGDVALVRLSDVVRQHGWEEAKKIPEVRRLLRYMGTEVVRDLIDPEYWVRYVRHQVAEHKNVVISDMRFWNEAEMVRSEGGFTVVVYREQARTESSHRSDNDLEYWVFDYVVVNEGSLVELYADVDGLLTGIHQRQAAS